MKSRKLILPVAIIAAICAGACRPSSSGSGGDDASAHAGKAVDYYCPMHPSYRSDEPGDCPICNMKLIAAEAAVKPAAPAAEVSEGVAGRADVEIPIDLQRRIGLATSRVERRPFARTIRAAGRVEIDERGLHVVSLRYGGWIEDLAVRATGESVRAGDRLLSIYSPELHEAQQSYLIARASLPKGDGVVRSARERLLLWDMSEAQVRELEQRGAPERTTPVLAKGAGVVTRREAVLGMRVEPGMVLYEIADLSTVWVLAEVYEDEVSLVRTGAKASIETASGEKLEGTVAFLYPSLSEATRTVKLRVEVENREAKLRPGTYATVSIATDLGEQLVVDAEAVLDTGVRKIVFVEAEPGRFEPREVRLGARGDGLAVVLEGLAEGDRVVSSAAFLVDSESRLRAAAGSR